MFEIEKGIESPKSVRKYPFLEMNIGDSFFVPCEDRGKRHAVRAAATYYNIAHGCKFTCRAVEGGIRVWRTE